MAQLVVRNLEEDVKAKLRRRAAAHGYSMEEEVRAILRDAVGAEPAREARLGTRIASFFTGIDLRNGEEIPELRGYAPKPATFDLVVVLPTASAHAAASTSAAIRSPISLRSIARS